ncbi:response regulator [Hymenobacter sp.]|jgi:CheY-like chemotaxis protein|uniref:response regulator n=1 Tax=Hymenobacter sp. TaxID=1898978 RepID=UPI002EDA6E2F
MLPSHPEILLIEDSAHDAELTFRALKAKMPSLEYYHLRNGEEALDYLLRRDTYDNQTYQLPLLILLDMDLPKIKGMQVLEVLKSDPRTKAVPVVVITVSTSAAQMQEAYQLGANSYIIKSMNFVKYSLSIAEIVHYWLFINDLPNYHKLSDSK